MSHSSAATSWFDNLSRAEGLATLARHGSAETWAAAEIGAAREAGLDVTADDLADAIRDLYETE